MPESLSISRPLLVYTMTSGLGDFIVMSDLARKVEKLRPGAQCLFVHRGNTHVGLWPGDDRCARFFNIYSAGGVASLLKRLKAASLDGFTIFGLQMAPGSLQGFLLHSVLKKMGLIDFIVDFNLINADIVTPPKGEYILDLHLNQVAQLFKVDVPAACHALELPFACTGQVTASNGRAGTLGIHPWSRRGHLSCFVWPFEKWLAVIEPMLARDDIGEIVIFGRDDSFASFRSYLLDALGPRSEKLRFEFSHSVEELTRTIAGVDLLLSVNTSVVHIGYALKKSMVILSGPSLDLWIPKHRSIRTVGDDEALLGGSDKWMDDGRFPSVARIETGQVIRALESLLLVRSGEQETC